MRRLAVLILSTVLVALGAAAPASASAPSRAGHPFPDVLPLPAGSYPEGIETGRGTTFYVGSLLDGAVYGGDLRTGDGAVVVPGAKGRQVAGLAFDRRSGLLWGVGYQDGAGAAFVFDPVAGRLVATVPLRAGDTAAVFPNDVELTRGAAYITDSLAPVLWTVPLDRHGLPAGDASALPLSGDFRFVTTGPLPINLNGIVAIPGGHDLIAVHTSLGVLYRIDPCTGAATQLDLGGASLTNGDGLLLQGRTLYVVRNFDNRVDVVRLSPDLTSGAVVGVRTSDRFHVPTTVAASGHSLYLVNSHFDTALPPLPFVPPSPLQQRDYEVVRIDR
jgi:hypothetical protein